MGFLRSKSRGTGDEVEQKKRNRLSKPLTNKSSMNLRTTAKQQSDNLGGGKSQSQLDIDQVVQSSTKEESRVKVRTHLFDKDNNPTTPSVKTNPQDTKNGVTHLVARFEQENQQQGQQPTTSTSALTDHTTMRSLPTLLTNSRLSLANAQCASPVAQKNDYRTSPRGTDSPIEEQMWDQLQSRYAVPMRRKSDYIPGEATRKQDQEVFDNPTAQEVLDVGQKDDDNISETWTAPVYPGDSRCGTPQNFERKALGNWSLGSLRVTNGRASPDLSEVSVHPRARPAMSRLRDVSSEYADSETWEDDGVDEDDSDTNSAGLRTPTTELQRNFSFRPGAEDDMTVRPEMRTPDRGPMGRSSEAASVLAEEYMAELPASPFAELTTHSSPASTGSVVHHNLGSGQDDFNYMPSGGREPIRPRNRVPSNESHASSTGSRPSLAESKLSSTGSGYGQDEVFQSALEFQYFPPPRSPDRPKPPFLMKEFEQSDSGYSSMNSVRSMQTVEDHAKAPALESVPEQPKTPLKKEGSPRKLGGFLPLRPAMKSRNTAPAMAVAPEPRPETSQSLNSAPIITDLEALSPSQTSQGETTPSKQRKKLQKLKPFEKFMAKPPLVPQELIVQRNSSAETYSIPTIPPQTIASLDHRVQQLPELERTVQNHSKKSSSTSTLAIPQEIRFPTPNPEPADDDRQSRKTKSRSKSRPRSKSRRRSMLEFFTGSKDEKRKSNISHVEPEMNIDDLGDVVSALGTNPYDIAIPQTRSSNRSRPGSTSHDSQMWSYSVEGQPSRDITPHRLSYPSVAHRYTMDDRTASEYARNRSRSIHERDHGNETPERPYPPTSFRSQPRPSSFNDRGGIPGKNLRSPSQSRDTPPPMPPMPSPAEIRRMSGRYESYETSQPSDHPTSSPWQQPSSPGPEDIAPPPPPHSPRPEYLDDHELDVDEPEDLSLAPPPPCHSPQPMDIEHQNTTMSDDDWATQARAWRARRQSAGETLRAKWGSAAQPHENAYTEDDDVYPSIPIRPRTDYFDGSENWPPATHTAHGWETDYNDRSSGHNGTQHWEEDVYYENDQSHSRYNYHDDPHGYYEDSRFADEDPHTLHHDQSHREHDNYELDPYHRGPSPAPSRPLPSRPGSRVSYRSNNSAISLAEELHPEVNERPSPAPSFGRYSGGLQYSYEGRNKGFGGSSGTRSVSGKADAQWKGMALKQTYGVDLGDVPIMGLVKPLR